MLERQRGISRFNLSRGMNYPTCHFGKRKGFVALIEVGFDFSQSYSSKVSTWVVSLCLLRQQTNHNSILAPISKREQKVKQLVQDTVHKCRTWWTLLMLDRNLDTSHPSSSCDTAPPLLRLAQLRLMPAHPSHWTSQLLTSGPKRSPFPNQGS